MEPQQTITACDHLVAVLDESQDKAIEIVAGHGCPTDHIPELFLDIFGDDRRRIAALRAKAVGELLAAGVAELRDRADAVESQQRESIVDSAIANVFSSGDGSRTHIMAEMLATLKVLVAGCSKQLAAKLESGTFGVEDVQLATTLAVAEANLPAWTEATTIHGR